MDCDLMKDFEKCLEYELDSSVLSLVYLCAKYNYDSKNIKREL